MKYGLRSKRELFKDILDSLQNQLEARQELRARFGITISGTDIGGFVGDTPAYDPTQKRILVTEGLEEAAEALGVGDSPMVSKGTWVEIRGNSLVLVAPAEAFARPGVDTSENVG